MLYKIFEYLSIFSLTAKLMPEKTQKQHRNTVERWGYTLVYTGRPTNEGENLIKYPYNPLFPSRIYYPISLKR